jgi:uncharacterized protein YerC
MDWNTKENKELIEAILALKNPEEAKSFLRDLMTEGEIVEFSKRLLTAKGMTKKSTILTDLTDGALLGTTINNCGAILFKNKYNKMYEKDPDINDPWWRNF